MHGFGKKYNRNGKVNCQGMWENGQLTAYVLTDEEQSLGFETSIFPCGIFVGNVVMGENSSIKHGI